MPDKNKFFVIFIFRKNYLLTKMKKNKLDDLFSNNVETLQDCLAYLVHSFTKDKNHATKV